MLATLAFMAVAVAGTSVVDDRVPVEHVDESDALALKWADLRFQQAKQELEVLKRRVRDKHYLPDRIDIDGKPHCGSWKWAEDWTGFTFFEAGECPTEIPQ